jgi:rhodanese-related sulfurtransferase
MDGNLTSVSPGDLYTRPGTALAPMLVDVRRQEALSADNKLIIGACHRPPEDVSRWLNELPVGRAVVAYCGHGRQTSQGVTASLNAAGIKAAYLEGGVTAWNAKNLPTRRKLDAGEKDWVTREHPKIDRIACPWLISRFINPKRKIHLCAAGPSHGGRQGNRGNSIRHQGHRIRPCRRSLFVRCDRPHLRYQGPSPRPSGDDRAGRRYVAPGPRASMRRTLCDIARTVGEFSRRSRNAPARLGHL